MPWKREISAVTMAVAILAPMALQASQPTKGTIRVKAEPDLGRWPVLRAGYRDAGTKVPANEAVLDKTLLKTASFIVTYNGFTPEAQAAFQHAVDIWEQLLTSPVPILVEANWTPLDPGVLGTAGANTYWSIGGVMLPDALADAISGVDLGGGAFDVIADFNSANGAWYTGTDGNTPSGQYDLVTAVLHQIAHGLGFNGLMAVFEGVGAWIFVDPAGYATFTEDLAGNSLVDPAFYPNFSTQLADVLRSGAVFFNGQAASAANGGNRPELFAPSQWTPGASYSHLDEAVYFPGSASSLMTPILDPTEAIHHPGPITLCILQDLGWTTSANCTPPEVASLSQIAGLVVPGFEVEVDNPTGPTTLFAARNTTDAMIDVGVRYFGKQLTDEPLRTDLFMLGPQQTVTVDVSSNLTDLEVTGGFAGGLIVITEAGDASAPNLEGDFFRLDTGNAFAAGDRMVRPEEFCSKHEVRYVDFGSGSQFRILIDQPRGPDLPSFTYTSYAESGDMIAQGEFFTSDHLSVIGVSELGIAGQFGTVLFDFSSSGGGFVSAEYSAFGLYSVELSSTCRD